MRPTFAIQPEDFMHSHMEEADALQFSIYDTTPDGRHGAGVASYVLALPTRAEAERIMATLEAMTPYHDVTTHAVQMIAIAIMKLQPLGFGVEIGGGGSTFLSRYSDSGRYIWATCSGGGGGAPSPFDFAVCAYPPHDEGEAVLSIVDDPDDRSAPTMELVDAVAACLGYADNAEPFALFPACQPLQPFSWQDDGAGDGALYIAGGRKWLNWHQRLSGCAGWGLSERDGGLCIVHDPEFGRFRDEEDATDHVQRCADGRVTVFSDRYNQLCRHAVEMLIRGQPDLPAIDAHLLRSRELAERANEPDGRAAFMAHHGFKPDDVRMCWRKANAAGWAEIKPEGDGWGCVVDAGGLGTHSRAASLVGAVADAEEALNEGGAGGAYAAPAASDISAA